MIITAKTIFRPRPSNPELSVYLDLLPENWLLPPADVKMIDEVDARLNGRLPAVMKEMHQLHGGMDKRADLSALKGLPQVRLIEPEKVMEWLRVFAQDRFRDNPSLAPWNDGRQSCFLGRWR